eukprot:6952437-Prymnesium_polylepis.1
MNELKRASEALDDIEHEQTRTDALRQRLNLLTDENKSLLDENRALRSMLQTQSAVCGSAGSPRPPAASPYNGGFTLTVSVPAGVQSGNEVRVHTPIGMVTAIVPFGLKTGDSFQIRVL